MNNNDFSSAVIEHKDDGAVNIRDLIEKYIYHWPVFLLGVLLCLTSGVIYLRYTQPTYSINGTLLIKDEKKGGMPAANDLLNDLDIFGTSKVVDNEIEILKSKTLMRKVVDRLNLSVSFSLEGRVKSSELYVDNPVRFGVIKMNRDYYGKSLHLSIANSQKYRLEDPLYGRSYVGEFGRLERTPFGVYQLDYRKTAKPLSKTNINVLVEDPSNTVNNLLNALTVSLASKQSSVLKLSMQSGVPEKAQDVLNTLIQVYNEAALADKNRTTQSTIEFIDERLMLITGELTTVEKDVEGFKSSRGLTEISADANLFLEGVKTNDAKLNEINLQLSVVNDIARFVNSKAALDKLPSTLGVNDPVLLGQITQLGELKLQRDQLLSTTTENNPLVIPLLKQIETTKAGIRSTIDNIAKSLEISKKDLESNNDQFQGSIKKIPGQERQLISIKRQQNIKESLYLYLLQKKEEAALSYASAVADSRIVDAAFYSTIPIKPKRSLVLLASFVLGLILPICYIYVKGILNNRLEGRIDLEKTTSTPLLGEILFNHTSEPIVVKGNSRTAIAEQFKAIRTNMHFLRGATSKGKVTLFTSGMSGEGKTFVATNLATALAISGKKTVLLELDLRKPKVSKYLGLENTIGLSNYLIGGATIQQILKPSNIDPNFYVIGSGPIPPNPSELLSYENMDLLIASLREDFEEILVDTPPIGLVADSQILARVADVTIYLVRQGVTFKEQIKNLDNLYKSRRFPNLNVLLNGVKQSVSYGYGYGYGYYTEDNRTGSRSFKYMLRNILQRF